MKAEKTEVEVVTKTEGIRLDLDMDEVKGLYAICLRISGSPEKSARRHASAFLRAVEEVLGTGQYQWDWLGKEYESVKKGAGLTARDYDEVIKKDHRCPYTQSHTKDWCGYDGCRES
jgi:hypothetical protein